jgi:hypothetical protein
MKPLKVAIVGWIYHIFHTSKVLFSRVKCFIGYDEWWLSNLELGIWKIFCNKMVKLGLLQFTDIYRIKYHCYENALGGCETQNVTCTFS